MFSKTLLRVAVMLLSIPVFFSCEKEPLLEEEKQAIAESRHFFDLESYRYKDSLRARFFDPEYLIRNADNSKGVNTSIVFRSEELLEELDQIQCIMGFQDSLMNYIPPLTERFGFPAWYYTLATNDGKFWFIPFFEEESSKTEAVLVIKVEGSFYDFRLIPRYEAETPVFTQVYAYNFYTSLNLFAIFDQWAFDYLDATWLSWYEEHADSLDRIIPRGWCIEYRCLPHIMNGGVPPTGGSGSSGEGPIAAVGPRGNPCPEGYDAFPFYYECGESDFGFGFGTHTGWGLTGYYEGNIHQGGNSNWNNGPVGGTNNSNNPPNWWDENALCLMDEGLGDGISSNSISELLNILPLNDRIRLRQLLEINQHLRLECAQTGELWNNPELQGGVYHFLQGEGWSPAALETMNLVLDSGVGGLMNTQGLSAILQGTADFLEEKNNDEASSQAAKTVLSLLATGKLTGPYTDTERQQIIQEHFFNPDQYVQFVTHCILLKAEWELNHPGQSCDESITCQVSVALEAYWKTVRGIVHTALDICGVVPVAGEGCDFANGTLYILEGDGVNASISFAATIPFLGWVASGAKWAKIIVETATGPLEFVVKLDLAGKITFPLPTGKTFREIVGITDPLDDAHHLIPQAVKNHDLVQQAASAKHKTFHLHHPKNGMAAKKYRINYQPNGIHANHPNYNNQVSQKMDEIIQDLETDYGTRFQQIDTDIVAERLINFQNSLRGLIEANPTTKINDLIIP